MAAMININGVDMPAPSAYRVLLQDLDSENTRRTETGVLQRDRIRAGVYRIEVTWKVPSHKVKVIANATQPAKINVRFYDPNTDSYIVRAMYVGDRSAELIKPDNGSPSDIWWELSTSFIEY